MEKTGKFKSGALLVFILTTGVFGIINTEMGVIGILPLIAETFHVTVPEAGWTVSVFALVVALSAPVMPLLFSGINRKKVMLLALGIFLLSNIISMITSNFTVLLLARALPAFMHPVYVSMAFTVAAPLSAKRKPRKRWQRFLSVFPPAWYWGSGNKLYRQRSFLYSRYGIFRVYQCAGIDCHTLFRTFYACERKIVLR